MYYSRIEVADGEHEAVLGSEELNDVPRPTTNPRQKLMAALIISSLPVIALWLLICFFWSDVKAVGRVISFYFKALSEEFARKA